MFQTYLVITRVDFLGELHDGDSILPGQRGIADVLLVIRGGGHTSVDLSQKRVGKLNTLNPQSVILCGGGVEYKICTYADVHLSVTEAAPVLSK